MVRVRPVIIASRQRVGAGSPGCFCTPAARTLGDGRLAGRGAGGVETRLTADWLTPASPRDIMGG